jgi:hypothetical protein
MVDSDGGGSVDVDTYLESPVINVNNGGANVYLSFDFYFNSYSGNEQGDVEVYDGSNWVVVATYQGQDYGGWESPELAMIDVTSYINPGFKVRFHYYNANWDWYWAVDNVALYTPSNVDLALVWGIPGVGKVNDHAFFSTIVFNNGVLTQDDFTVSVTVTDPMSNVVYSDSQNITGAGLVSGAYFKVNFPTPMPLYASGNYLVSYHVSVANDEDTSNDDFLVNLEVRDFQYQNQKVYTYIAADLDSSNDQDEVGYFDPVSGAYTPVDSISGMVGDFLTGGDFLKDMEVLAAVDNYNTAYFIDGDGTAYEYGYFPFLSDVITGLAFPLNTDDAYYSTTSSLYLLTPYLDTLKIGDYSPAGVTMLGIALDTLGNLYGLDMQSDKLYQINTTDASLTEVGSLGISDIAYIQDIGIDAVTNKLYGTLFYEDNNNDYHSGLYEIDKSTGMATLIGAGHTDEYSLCAVSPGQQQSVARIDDRSWSVYPVPFKDVLHIRFANNLPDRVQVVDVSGKILLDVTPSENRITFELSRLKPGTYWVRIFKDGNISVKPVLKN